MTMSCRDDFDEVAAEMMLEVLRWGDDLERWCPICGEEHPVAIKTRKVYRCRKCNKQFTATSGTVFDRHKLPASKLIKAMLWYEETQGKGSPSDLARLLGCQWKTAYVLKMRLWEGFAADYFFAPSPFFARWYWQGFNHWQMDEATGQLVRKHKDGRVRAALIHP